MNLSGSLPGVQAQLPPGQIEVFPHEREQIDPIVEGLATSELRMDFRGRVYRAVRRIKMGDYSAAGMETPSELAIEVNGKQMPLEEGIKALWRADREREAKQDAARAEQDRALADAQFRVDRWKALARLERALRMAAHESTDPVEKSVFERLLSTYRRDPQAPPDGMKF